MIVNESLIVGNGKYLSLKTLDIQELCTLFILSLRVCLINLFPDLQKCNAN